MRTWDAQTGSLLSTTQIGGTIKGLSFHPSGRLLAVGSTDGRLRVLDLENMAIAATFDDHVDMTVHSVEFDRTGRMLVSPAPGGTVIVRDTATWDVLTTIEVGDTFYLRSVRFSPDGETLAVAMIDGSVELWSLDGESLGVLPVDGRPPRPWTSAFSADGRYLAAGGWTFVLHVWDLETRTEIAQLAGHGPAIWGVAFCPDDPNLVVTCSGDGTARIWDVANARVIYTIDELDGLNATCVDFTRDEHGLPRLLVAGADGHVVVWSPGHYDRHIVGNLDHQIARLREELGDRVDHEALEAIREDVLSRPSPRPNVDGDAE